MAEHRAATYKRAKITPVPIPNFRPQPGDIIIRKLPDTGSQQILMLDGLVTLVTDRSDETESVNERGTQSTIFESGDLILRHGYFTATHWRWEFEHQATLYLYWTMPYEQSGKWYKVADRIDILNRTIAWQPEWVDIINRDLIASGSSSAPRSQLQFTSSDTLNIFRFYIYKGDYVISHEGIPSFNCPWGKNFTLKIIPQSYDARNSGRDFGAGDVLVRIHVSESYDSGNRKYVKMQVHGILNLGGQLDWRYMGKFETVFQKRVDGGGSPSSSRTKPKGPVRPGDIIFNLDEVLHGVNHEGSWMGGHVMIMPDGPLDHHPENFSRSMLLRLGSFSSDIPSYFKGKEYWRWIDDSMEMYIHGQSIGSWAQTPINVIGSCPGGIFPLCNFEFEKQFTDDPVEIGSRANIRPCPTDVIYSYSNAHVIERAHFPNDDDWRYMEQVEHQERFHEVRFWTPSLRLKPTDALIRFSSQPADSPEQGQWILAVELYQYASGGNGSPKPWQLKGRDIVIYPSQN